MLILSHYVLNVEFPFNLLMWPMPLPQRQSSSLS